MRKAILGTTAAAAIAAAGLLPAQAATITGAVYSVTSGIAGSSTLANAGNGTLIGHFSAPSSPVNFGATSGDYTVTSFVANGGGTFVPLASGPYGLDNTQFVSSGTVTVTNGETFRSGHDDGMTLEIGGVTVISAPGSTSFTYTTATYAGPSGNQAYELVYSECCGAPAYLKVDLPFVSSPLPEPASLAVFGTGLLGLGFVLRKNRHRPPS